MHLAERNDLAHRLIVPVSEWTDNMWDISSLNWLEVWHYIRKMIDRCLVIIDHFRVFDLRELGDTRCPQEERKDVLTTVPALAMFICAHVPLARHRHDIFEAQVPLNDELRYLVDGVLVSLIVNAHRLYNIP